MNELRCLRAIDRGDINLIKTLISNGHDFNSGVGQRKMPPVIYYAVQNNFTEAVELLVKAGCNVNVKYTPELKTPLYVSSYIGNKFITSILCENGANVNELTTKGETALFAAIEWSALSNNLTIIEILLSFGAEVNIISKNGTTPLLKSIEVECFPAIQLLIENGAKLDLINYEELKCALKRNNNQIIEYLLRVYGSNRCNEEIQSVVSPVDLCLQYLNLKAMKIAIELGFSASDKLFENPLILLKTILPNSHKSFEEAKYCFDYLLTFKSLIDFNYVFAFKYELSVATQIINGNLLTYALVFNCSHMSYRLIQIGSNIERSFFNYYRFDYNDLDSLKLLYFCGIRFPTNFNTKCYPMNIDLNERSINKSELKCFCQWIKCKTSQPYSLMEIIRIKLRKKFGINLFTIVSKLELPNQIIKYLLFEI
jgi:ankyrin repeat protein